MRRDRCTHAHTPRTGRPLFSKVPIFSRKLVYYIPIHDHMYIIISGQTVAYI